MGRGLFQGTQTNFEYVPEQETDFIFTAVGEQLGFIGAILVIAAFSVIVWRLLVIAANARDRFGALIAAGIAAMVVFHVFVNVGMTIGIMPVTGIPLPFLSVGWIVLHGDDPGPRSGEFDLAAADPGPRREPAVLIAGRSAFGRQPFDRRRLDGSSANGAIDTVGAGSTTLTLAGMFRRSHDGWVEVICGPMFSGKSEELIRRVTRSQIARIPVQTFKPLLDDRYADTEVVSHSSLKVDAIPVETSDQLLRAVEDSHRGDRDRRGPVLRPRSWSMWSSNSPRRASR